MKIAVGAFLASLFLATVSPCQAASDYDGLYKGKMIAADHGCFMSDREMSANVTNGHFSMLWNDRYGIMATGEIPADGVGAVVARNNHDIVVSIHGEEMTIENTYSGCRQSFRLTKQRHG